MRKKQRPDARHLSRVIVGDITLSAHRDLDPIRDDQYRWQVKGADAPPEFIGSVKDVKRHLDVLANAYLAI